MSLETFIAGVDEAGRGPLAGPVIAAAVILHPEKPIKGLADSKKLSSKKREELTAIICEQALCYAIGRAEVFEIDELNILRASLLAMQRAIAQLVIKPTEVLIDGNFVPDGLNCPAQAIIKGDDKVEAISAASILAKVTRDREMLEMENHYPGYGLAKHKGYPTAKHLLALKELGASAIHRRSFAPVQLYLKK